MGEPNTSDYIQIDIRVQNSSKEPPVSSKAQNKDFRDIDVICTLKIKIERQNLENGFSKDQLPNLYQNLQIFAVYIDLKMQKHQNLQILMKNDKKWFSNPHYPSLDIIG